MPIRNRHRWNARRALFAGLLSLFGALGLVLPAGTAAQTVLKVGVYDNPPKVFQKPSGEATGSFVDLAEELAKAEGWQLEFVACEWQACLDQLELGELDLMPDVAISDERQRRFDFHQIPAMHSWSQLYRRSGIRVDSVLDLQGLRVAALSSGIQADSLRSMLDGFNVKFEMVPVRNVREAFELTASGRADLAAASYHFGDYRAAEYGLVGTPIIFQPSRLFFAAPKSRHTEKLQAIDERLNVWLQDDQSPYFQVLKRWGVRHEERPLPPILVNSLIGAGVLALLLGLNVVWLRSRVRAAVSDLRATNRQLEATLKAVPDLMFEIDSQGTYLAVHTKQEDLLAAPKNELKGKTVDQVLPPDGARAVHESLRTALEQGHSAGQSFALPLPDGVHWFELSAARKDMPAGQAPHVMVLSRDITQRMQDQAEIQRLADFDHLTGLPNRAQMRRLFEKTLSLAQRHQQQVAVIFMDVDHFKNINDSLGHEVGDKLLTGVAQRLLEDLRDSDIACRLGGDEFVLILYDIDADNAARIALRLRDRMHVPFKLGQYEIGIGLSLGIAMFPDDGSTIDTLLRNADTALYQAKAEGRNDYRFFTSSMQQRSERILLLSSALEKALERQQLQAHYQPLVALDTGHIVGVEALMRWHHPDLGAVSPSEFIPVAESTGLILPMGEWMLRQACEQAVRWTHMGRRLKVAVNVSIMQFRHPGFVEQVAGVLRSTGLAPELLELEVTESLTMGDPKAAQNKMQALQALGLRIAIDDFGTGYSSMSYLSRLGFHKLKIDQSFVQHIGQDHQDEAIIAAIVQLAQSLGLETLAEGVETQAQRDFLGSTGCQYIQGWLVSKAMPVDTFDDFYQRYTPTPAASD